MEIGIAQPARQRLERPAAPAPVPRPPDTGSAPGPRRLAADVDEIGALGLHAQRRVDGRARRIAARDRASRQTNRA